MSRSPCQLTHSMASEYWRDFRRQLALSPQALPIRSDVVELGCRGEGGDQRRRLEEGRQEVTRGQDLGPGSFPLD